jgi:hypothetical protein
LGVSPDKGGAGAAGAPRPGGERGSQSLELALVLPGIVLLCALLVHAGVLGADLVLAQGLAREAVRTASVDDDAAVGRAVRAAVGRRPLELSVTPASGRRVRGQLVTVRLRLRSRAFAAFGVEAWAPASATMRVEAP